MKPDQGLKEGYYINEPQFRSLNIISFNSITLYYNE